MSRTRIIEVVSCGNCPLMKWDHKDDICLRKDGKKIENINSIPEWCPLEYYPYYYGNDEMKDEYGDY